MARRGEAALRVLLRPPARDRGDARTPSQGHRAHGFAFGAERPRHTRSGHAAIDATWRGEEKPLFRKTENESQLFIWMFSFMTVLVENMQKKHLDD